WSYPDLQPCPTRRSSDLAAVAGHGPFNALFWDGRALVHASNHPATSAAPVPAGVHAMSNGAFDAPWPKSRAATRALEAWLCSPRSEEHTSELQSRENLVC